LDDVSIRVKDKYLVFSHLDGVKDFKVLGFNKMIIPSSFYLARKISYKEFNYSFLWGFSLGFVGIDSDGHLLQGV
jgi:hypothetical protein